MPLSTRSIIGPLDLNQVIRSIYLEHGKFSKAAFDDTREKELIIVLYAEIEKLVRYKLKALKGASCYVLKVSNNSRKTDLIPSFKATSKKRLVFRRIL